MHAEFQIWQTIANRLSLCDDDESPTRRLIARTSFTMAAQYENLSSDLIWQISRTFPTRTIQITWRRESDMLVERGGNFGELNAVLWDGHIVAQLLEDRRTRYPRV